MNKRLALLSCLLLIACLLLAGCRSPARDTLVAPAGELPMTRGPLVTASFEEDFAWAAGLTATLTVTWAGGNGPYAIQIDMGGGTTEDMPAGTPATSPFTKIFTLAQEGTFVCAVAVTDSKGYTAVDTISYVVGGQPGPVIVAAKYDRLEQLLRVATAQQDGRDTTIALSDLPEWVEVDGGLTRIVKGGTGVREFDMVLLPHVENECEINILATDPEENQQASSVEVARPLFIQRVLYDYPTGAITVEVDATWEQDITVELQPPAGVEIAGDLGVAKSYWDDFNFQADWDVESFPGGELTVTAADQLGHQDTEVVYLYASQFEFAPDTLYAYPQQSVAAADDQVLVVVVTGALANPFQYLNGVAVTVDSGATYVDNSFNVGAPGGARDYADGLWQQMAAALDSFLLAPDWWMQENTIDNGRVRIAFNVTPLGGTEITGGGELFNFCLQFDHTGTYTLGFEGVNEVKRTYFSDGSSTEYSWDDISNDHPGVPNTIVVQ